MKVMAVGLGGGTSFMEDYTYHLDPAGMKVLGAHMLEICPTVAEGKPRLEVHPLSIGGKEDPARLVFNAPAGPAINVTVIDMGNRFRMIVNPVDVVQPDAPLPHLPVARALWTPRPTSRSPLRPGSLPAASITPASARLSPSSIWRTSPGWRRWKSW
jgi:L-arabinose isomerase